jgi:CBS domain-containing protein
MARDKLIRRMVFFNGLILFVLVFCVATSVYLSQTMGKGNEYQRRSVAVLSAALKMQEVSNQIFELNARFSLNPNAVTPDDIRFASEKYSAASSALFENLGPTARVNYAHFLSLSEGMSLVVDGQLRASTFAGDRVASFMTFVNKMLPLNSQRSAALNKLVADTQYDLASFAAHQLRITNAFYSFLGFSATVAGYLFVHYMIRCIKAERAGLGGDVFILTDHDIADKNAEERRLSRKIVLKRARQRA